MILSKLVSFFQKKSESGRGLQGRNSPLDKTNDIWQPLSLLRGGETPKGRMKNFKKYPYVNQANYQINVWDR